MDDRRSPGTEPGGTTTAGRNVRGVAAAKSSKGLPHLVRPHWRRWPPATLKPRITRWTRHLPAGRPGFSEAQGRHLWRPHAQWRPVRLRTAPPKPPKLAGTPYPAPIATHTGWALRAEPAGANDGCDGAGQMIDPVRQDEGQADRQRRSRPSLEERYLTHNVSGRPV